MPRVLIVGSGAREHALARALSKEAKVWVAPGNPGTLECATNVEISIFDVAGMVSLAIVNEVDFVVVGPEMPLTLGLIDALNAKGIAAFGPTKENARLEGSKTFMKQILCEANVLTPPFATFDSPTLAYEYVTRSSRPLVIKADGLTTGKGVFVAGDADEACRAIDKIMVMRVFGEAGRRVMIEDVLPGVEANFHVVCDGTRAFALPAVRDHKRLGEGEVGLNTPGMGAYGPSPIVSTAIESKLVDTVVEPVLHVLSNRGQPFRGCLSVGLMIDAGNVHVFEMNVRFGDPEAGVLVPLLDGSWLDLLSYASQGDLRAFRGRAASTYALSVVLASHGYPGQFRIGDRISGLDRASAAGASILHAGTRTREGHFETAGGRVLNVVGQGDTLDEAKARAYSAVDAIWFDGKQYRQDIGDDATPGPEPVTAIAG